MGPLESYPPPTTPPEANLPAWVRVWRYGIAPVVTTGGLRALRRALESDDPALLQGITVEPVCIGAPGAEYGTADQPAVAWCPLALCARAEGLETVGQIDHRFAEILGAADGLLGRVGETRHWIDFWDDHPREVVREALLAEVRRALARREEA